MGSAPALLLALACLALGSPCLADKPAPSSGAWATLRGQVHAQGSPDPIPYATLRFQAPPLVLTADRRGRFSASGPAGLWTFSVQADGYAPLTKTVRLKAGAADTLNPGLVPTGFQEAEVDVLGHVQRPQAIQASVTRAQIKEIPGTFGDALRALAILPGVGLASDLSGQLLVQGGGPEDNLYLIDSIPWPIPYHFGGLASTVSPDLLKSVDLFEAGYSARWGGALAGVVNAQTQAPSRDRLHADADLGILQASAALSGPLGLGNATFTLTGRRSYFDLVGNLAGYPHLPAYWDSQGALDFSLDPNNRFHALMLGSNDAFNDVISGGGDFSGSIQYDEGFGSGGLSWINTALPGFVSTLTPYACHSDTILQVSTLADDSYQSTYGLKEETLWAAGTLLGAKHEVAAGADIESTQYTFYGSLPRVTSTANISFSDLTSLPEVESTVLSHGLNSYAYVQDRAQWDESWALTVGAHYDSDSLVADGELGPRLSLEFKPRRGEKLCATWGLYDQAPSALQVNPQYGNPGLEPESAEHTTLSYDHDFNPNLTGKVDVYYKALSDLVVSDPSNPCLYDNKGVGDVKGLDLYLTENLGDHFFGTLSYSLSDSSRLDLPAQAWGLYQYDQPNILNAVASYSTSPRWTFGCKLRYNSGNLVLPQGDDTYDGSDRLPYYLRLDLRTERKWRFDVWTLTAYFEIINILDRKNIAMEFVNNSGQTGTVPDLPRFPNIGVEAEY
ncbi:MAG TPA: TonB-dependent receptor [bacterium]|jgi:hypothetical protein|nr:TonB-dependent receptor [bacterium]